MFFFRLSVLGSGVFGQLNAKLIQLQNELLGVTFMSCGDVLLDKFMTVQSMLQDMQIEEQKDCNAYRNAIDDINDNLNDQTSRDLVKAKSDTVLLKIMVIKVRIFKTTF